MRTTFRNSIKPSEDNVTKTEDLDDIFRQRHGTHENISWLGSYQLHLLQSNETSLVSNFCLEVCTARFSSLLHFRRLLPRMFKYPRNTYLFTALTHLKDPNFRISLSNYLLFRAQTFRSTFIPLVRVWRSPGFLWPKRISRQIFHRSLIAGTFKAAGRSIIMPPMGQVIVNMSRLFAMMENLKPC